MTVTHKPTAAEARKFLGTLEDAESVKEWASDTEIAWTPVDDNYDGKPGEEPDLSKGVTLDIVGTLGYQAVEKGDWLLKDSLGIIAYQSKYFYQYFTEST